MEWELGGPELSPTGAFGQLDAELGGIRALAAAGDLLFVGSTANALLSGSLAAGFQAHVQGHRDEVWTVAGHPASSQFLSGGFDKRVCLWDAAAHALCWQLPVGVWLHSIRVHSWSPSEKGEPRQDPVRSLDWHPGGLFFAVGTTIGRWLVLDAATRDVIHSEKVSSTEHTTP